ncbi:MAG: tetratricopeptide repeat protein [Pseudomonadota bacterium]
MPQRLICLCLLVCLWLAPVWADTAQPSAPQLDEQADAISRLNNQALIHFNSGQYVAALPLFQRALALSEQTFGAVDAGTATSLNNLAMVYSMLGQYELALPLYQRALAIRQQALGAEDSLTATSLTNLAVLYETLGQYDEALPLLQDALAIAEKSPIQNQADLARGLNNLAVLYKTLGRFAEALPLLQRALDINEKTLGAEHINTAASLNNLAATYDALGQYEQALPLFQRALAIREKVLGREHADTILTLNNLAFLYGHTQQPALALPLYLRAYRAALWMHKPDMLKFVQYNLGRLYADQGNASSAIFHLKGAVNTMQRIRADAKGLDKVLQKSLLKKNEEVYRKLANYLVMAGRLAEAQQVLAMLKEDEYFDFIRRDAAADMRTTHLSYSGAEKPYAEQLEKLGKTGTRLLAQRDALIYEQEKLRGDIQKQLAEYEKQTLALLNEIPLTLPTSQQNQLAQQRAEQAQLAAGIQQQLAQLGQGVTLVQYLLLGDKIHIIVTDRVQQRVREAPVGEAVLYPKLVALRKVLEDPRYDARPLAQELYRDLIAPIEADIRHSQTLMFAPDGALRYIPFAALHDGKQYLVERYPLALYTAAAQDKLTASGRALWKIEGLGVTQAHPGFSELPGVKAELSGIIGRHGLPGAIHLDQQFTAAQMQTSLKQGQPVLHIASHFKFTPGTEADSYLLLGDGNHLSLKQLREGDYPFGQLDLLTLSACATAMQGGHEANGKEVEGFGALAQHKGAKAVLATLWPIADTSTAPLMQTLYRSRQQQHLNKAQALRQAQLALLYGGTQNTTTRITPDKRGGKYVSIDGKKDDAILFQIEPGKPFAHPYYWAPFILMGNWL